MASLLREGIIVSALGGMVLGLTLVAPATLAAELTPNERARYLSFALRDQPLSLDEARALHAGHVTLYTLVDSWFETEPARDRVHRFFNDMFGNANDEGVQLVPLTTTADGVYTKFIDEPCTLDEAIETNAWWTDQKVLMCPSAVSDEGYLIQNDEFIPCQFLGIFYTECGCGPDNVLCLPDVMRGDYLEAGFQEPAKRGVWAYDNDKSWLDWIGGDTLYANRYLYHFYLSLRVRLPLATEGELAKFRHALMAVPLDRWVEVPYPEGGPDYAGFITGPAFLAQHNNFRSRIAAMTDTLLCADVGPFLNSVSDQYPGGIETFLNPDHDELTLSHSKPECSGCHYPMDNMGSTLFEFGTIGESDDFAEDKPSTLGHVFGETGSGPQFLARGFVERAANFHPCMAITAWEDLSGESWRSLTDAEQDELVSLAEKGPRSLIRSILSGGLLRAQR